MANTDKRRGAKKPLVAQVSDSSINDFDHSAAMLAAIVNSSFDAIISKNLEGIVTSWNPAAESMFGYTAAEMIGSSITKLIPPELHSEEAIILAQIRRGDTVEHFETQRVAKDGRVIQVSVTISPIRSRSGEIIGASKVSRDITERKRSDALLKQSEETFRTMANSLRETQARLNSTLGAAAVGTWTWDIYSNILTADEFTSRIFALDAQEASAGLPVESYFEVIHVDDKALVADSLALSIDTGSPYNVEFRVRQANGEDLWLLSRGRVESDATGTATHFHGAVMDITEHKRAQETIQALNDDLERRVAERTIQLEEAVKELETFSYTVSHDLQAPLRTMNGLSQAVLEDFGPLLPEEGKHYLRTIRKNAQKMSTLVGDLLSFAASKHHDIAKQQLDTEQMVREILVDLEAQYTDRHIEVQVASLPPCLGDPNLLKQVWTNLLSNAFKYTRKCEHARVEIGWGAGTNGDAYFIRDNGVGFDMQYAERLFSVFQRFHSQQEYEGSGVGLATVRRIIQRHGGTIWAEAGEAGGATFYFTLA